MLALARIATGDVARAKRFFGALAEILGAQLAVDRKGLVGFRGPEGALLLIGKPAQGAPGAGNGSQVSLLAPSRDAVDDAYRAALAMGGESVGEPGVRGDRLTGPYAAYFRDPDGNKIMVMHVAQVQA